ncbi:PIR Superfamily Protein [Plasmodium ovale wallikeri]|uniref:Plasmodium vivax Vir protein, putative n=2 Tax=Plasmodium ovale TaxID=36330 RepID=A0A1C3KFF0_PLAOA|nr:PIR Superfamily Protein [Plasmodium ovale wallikeri]SBT72369.1 Plasmodium vivax Vir protein, putative [Plasmodium ovale]
MSSSTEEESMYAVVSWFPNYRSILNGIISEYDSQKETYAGGGYYDSDPSKYHFTIALLYLTQMKESQLLNIITCCKYIYYWLYNEAESGKLSVSNATELYLKLMEILDSVDLEYYKSKINIISYDIFENVKSIYELYDNLNGFKTDKTEPITNRCHYVETCFNSYMKYEEECSQNHSNALCNEMENFRSEYNKYMKEISACGQDKQMLPSFKSHNIAVIVLIPLFIILVIVFLLYYLYKFTPYGSYIYPLIRKKKHIWSNLDKEDEEFHKKHELFYANTNIRQYNL